MPSPDWTTVVTGLAFAEAPRWRDGRLWFSDIFGGAVLSVRPGGEPTLVTEVHPRPSGLGWRPDGTLLVVSMHDHRLLAVAADGTTSTVADMSPFVRGDCNDMVVDAHGRAYVGSFGYDLVGGEDRRPATIVTVAPDGTCAVAAEDLWFPNGMVVTADGGTLIVAETRGERITAFAIGADGALSDRRTFAEVEGVSPDGICLDAEGALWVASPYSGEILRLGPDGEVLTRLEAPFGKAQACMLGGDDGRTLFACHSPTGIEAEALEQRGACILATTVDVPHAGLP